MVNEYAMILIAAGAMCQDLRRRKVSNRYLLICLVSAGLLRLFVTERGFPDVSDPVFCRMWLWSMADAACGMLIPLFLLGWLFLFRMLGAGDIKLLSLLGLLAGAGQSLQCVIRTMLFAAVFAVGILAAAGNAKERFHYLGSYVRQVLLTGRRTSYRTAWDPSANLHMTVPVLMAVLSLKLPVL